MEMEYVGCWLTTTLRYSLSVHSDMEKFIRELHRIYDSMWRHYHGYYIGYKFQIGYNELTEDEQEELEEWTFDLLDKLYQNELKYTELLYDEVGYTEDVKQFLKYNADKALMNLGFDTLFEVGREDINPLVMNGISTETANHDFFSAVGNGYLLGEVEAMKDDDYALIKEKLNK